MFCRYYYICKYGTYLKHFTKIRIILYVVAIWLVSYFVHMPNHIGWGMVRYSTNFKFCTFDSDHFTYSLFYAAILFLAIAVTAIFYIKLYLVIRSSHLPRQLLIKRKSIPTVSCFGSFNANLIDELRLAKASFKIFIVFLIFWAPVTVLILISLGDRIPEWVYLYSALAAHSNSTLNVFIYYLDNRIFRNAIKKLLCPRRINLLTAKLINSNNNCVNNNIEMKQILMRLN